MFVGKPPGNYDRILDFSTAVTGNLFFVPTADFLDDPPVPGAAPVSTARTCRRPRRDDGSLGIGSLKGAHDEPPAALARADQRGGLAAARRRGARAADAGARRPQAGRLLGPARLGALGDQSRAHEAAGVGAERRRVRLAAARAAARRAARRLRALARRAARRRPRRRRRRPRAARRGRAPDRGGRERGRLPRLAGSDQRASPRRSPHRADTARRGSGRIPAAGGRRGRAAAGRAGSAAPTGSRSEASSTGA